MGSSFRGIAWVGAFLALFAIAGWLSPAARDPGEAKIAEILHGASLRALGLLLNDAYAEHVYTDPPAIFGAEPRGISFEDKTFVHIGFPTPPPGSEISCDAVPTDRLAVIIVAGQSNAENATRPDDLYQPQRRFYNLNIEDGGCYVAGQHALGTTGHGSSFVLPLADELLGRGMYANVLIVPIAIGGTYIEEWRPDGGRYFERFERAIAMLERHHLPPSFIVWQHGEANAGPLMRDVTFGLFGDSQGARVLHPWPALREAAALNYRLRFHAIVRRLREMGVAAPILASVSTTCAYDRTEPSIRAAQQALADPAWGVYVGADTDALPFGDRYDGCHFSGRGIVDVASLWVARLADVSARLPSTISGAIPDPPG